MDLHLVNPCCSLQILSPMATYSFSKINVSRIFERHAKSSMRRKFEMSSLSPSLNIFK